MLLEKTRMREMMLKARTTFNPINTSRAEITISNQISIQRQMGLGLTSSWWKHGCRWLVEVKGSLEEEGDCQRPEHQRKRGTMPKSESERNRKRGPVSDTRVVRRGLAEGRDRNGARLQVR